MTWNTTNSTVSRCTLHGGPLPAGARTTIEIPTEALTAGTPSASSSANQTKSQPNVPSLVIGQNSTQTSSFPRGTTAGISIAATILVLILILAALCIWRRRSRRAHPLEGNTAIGNPTDETRLYGSIHEQRKC
jgi:hypothetical protein